MLLLCDGGGSNSCRHYVVKEQLIELSQRYCNYYWSIKILMYFCNILFLVIFLHNHKKNQN